MRKFAVSLLAAMLFVLAAGRVVRADSFAERLVGTLKFAVLEGPDYGRPPPESPLWTSYALTQQGVSGRIEHVQGVGWAVVKFQLQNVSPDADYAFLLSDAPDAEEFYLNGVFIGRKGEVGPNYDSVPRGPRRVAVPRGLAVSGANELALKFLLAERNIHVFGGPVWFGHGDRIDNILAGERFWISVLETALLTFLLTLVPVYGFLVLNGMNRSDYKLFVGFTLVNIAGFCLDSNLLETAGIEVPHSIGLALILQGIRLLITLALVTRLTDSRKGYLYKIFLALGSLYLALCLLLPPLTLVTALSEPFVLFQASLGIYYVFMTVRALFGGKEDSLYVLLGVSAYVAASRADLIVGTDVRWIGVVIFSYFMLFALMARHARLSSRIVEISGRLLEAHEEERRRIARDIHDGIGQSILGLKLRLQMAERNVDANSENTHAALKKLVEQTDFIVRDVRAVSMDLCPPDLDSATIIEAIDASARPMLEAANIQLKILGALRPDQEPPIRVKVNLFRIVQEAVANAVKHSKATRMNISVHRSDDKIIVTAADNGVGFDPSGVSGGYGLKTMAERAQLLGGALTVESSHGQGSQIRLEVPMP